MNTGLLLGCALGGALLLLLLALVPPRPSLASAAGRWERQRASRVVTTNEGGAVRSEALGRWIATQLSRRGVSLEKLRADLALAEVPIEAHMVRKATYALVGLLLPSILTLALGAAGISLPITIPAVIGLLLGAVFFWVPDLAVAQLAERRRHELRQALGCYLDLVAMTLAGGRGVPEALPTAAAIGRGWAFNLLLETIARARYTGDTPWKALGELGERTGMQELEDLGGSLLLVADDGARIRASLTARASTQRKRRLAEAEGEAEKGDQSIRLAQIVLAIGFLLFLGYPAVVNVLAI